MAPAYNAMWAAGMRATPPRNAHRSEIECSPPIPQSHTAVGGDGCVACLLLRARFGCCVQSRTTRGAAQCGWPQRTGAWALVFTGDRTMSKPAKSVDRFRGHGTSGPQNGTGADDRARPTNYPVDHCHDNGSLSVWRALRALATTGGGCILLDRACRPSAIGLEDIFPILVVITHARSLVNQLATRRIDRGGVHEHHFPTGFLTGLYCG
ncbi:hypothetical protein BU23DRAFT_598733 [Bimuria novae-zelandiae CBS 107.79]|uniref:Uncharacterized protein n=1 Tax=Bimuria novae-zelandiae CBS 107.79 TaxID=1447943 RepID=A0A6A5V9T9_9PLEO|nr:hypothetical protein BU23DRAFT_598733 [Bimuria novae-zelandiae CBS 107.79]